MRLSLEASGEPYHSPPDEAYCYTKREFCETVPVVGKKRVLPASLSPARAWVAVAKVQSLSRVAYVHVQVCWYILYTRHPPFVGMAQL